MLNKVVPMIEDALSISREDARGLAAFLFVLGRSPDPLSPSIFLDELWHSLLLRPLSYQRICGILVGFVLDHRPENSLHSLAAKRKRRKKAVVCITELLGVDHVHTSFHTIQINISGLGEFRIDVDATVQTLMEQMEQMEQTGLAGKEDVVFVSTGESEQEICTNQLARPLWKYGIDDGAVLVLRKKQRIQVFVKGLAGRTFSISVSPEELVRNVKRKIQPLENVLPKDQRLIFGGRQLEDERTLADYKVQQESTLHLCVRLVGC